MSVSERPSLDLFDAIADPVIVWDSAGAPLFINRAATELLGWTEDALRATPTSLATGGLLADLLAGARPHLDAAAGRMRLGVCAIRTADGRTRHACAHATALDAGAWLLQLRLVSEPPGETEHFRAVFDNAEDGIFIKDRGLRYVAVNPSLCAILGRPEADLLGRRAGDLFPPDVATTLEDIDRRVLNGEQVESVDELPIHGQLHTVQIVRSPVRDASGRIVGVCAISRNVTSARRLEQALRDSEERLRILTENLPGAVFSYIRDVDGRQVDAYRSAGLARILGAENARKLNADEIEYRALVHPDDWNSMPPARPMADSDRLRFEAEYRVLTDDGDHRWVHVQSTGLPISGGRVLWYGVVLDVDERKRMDARLRTVTRQLQALTEHMPGVVFSYSRSPDGRRESVYLSPGLEAQLGPELASRAQGDVDLLLDLMHPDDRPAVTDGDTRLPDGVLRSDVEYRTLTDAGTYRWMYSRATGLPQHDGSVLWHGFIVDIDERKRMEEALGDAHRRLQSLADNLPGLIYSYRRHVDGHRESIFISPGGLEAIVGPRHAAAMQRNLDFHDTLLHPEDPHTLAPMRPGPDGAPLLFHREYRLRHDDGDYRWVDSRATGFPEVDGTVLWHGLMIDITRRKRAEEELRLHSDTLERANRELDEAMLRAESGMAARARFLATMSHEIRTPLTAILGFAELLLESPEPDPARMRESLELISDNGQYLLKILNEVLDYSRIEAGKLALEAQAYSPAELLDELRALMRVRAEAKGLELKLDLDAGLPASLQGDSTRLRQILLNLIGNAVKFTHDGCVCVRAQVANQKLQVFVDDTGIGLPPGDLERLFDAFEQGDASDARAYAGTGLGLAISRSLARLMGGDIGALRRPQGGSRFVVTLPAITQVPAGATVVPGSPLANGGRLRGHVLLVEDNATNRTLARLLLEDMGVTVEEAEDGHAALRLAKAARDAGALHDAVLMDIQMPGLDGYAATRALREGGYTLPIIALTAHALEEHREKCLAAGCDDYCPKPIDRNELFRILAVWLSAQGANSAEP